VTACVEGLVTNFGPGGAFSEVRPPGFFFIHQIKHLMVCFVCAVPAYLHWYTVHIEYMGTLTYCSFFYYRPSQFPYIL
jgi:hypothetical protein